MPAKGSHHRPQRLIEAGFLPPRALKETTMAYSLPEGSSQQFSNTLASAKTVTAITNANPAVATCTGHGYTTGDEIMLSSGWEDATDSVYKIEAVDANSFKILGLDTTNTSFFPPAPAAARRKTVRMDGHPASADDQRQRW